MRELGLEFSLRNGNGKILLQLQLGSACRIWSLPVQELVYEDSKCPDIGLGAIDVVDKSFRRHVDRRPDVDILKLLSNCYDDYLVNLANPKSAIFALLL